MCVKCWDPMVTFAPLLIWRNAYHGETYFCQGRILTQELSICRVCMHYGERKCVKIRTNSIIQVTKNNQKCELKLYRQVRWLPMEIRYIRPDTCPVVALLVTGCSKYRLQTLHINRKSLKLYSHGQLFR